MAAAKPQAAPKPPAAATGDQQARTAPVSLSSTESPVLRAPARPTAAKPVPRPAAAKPHLRKPAAGKLSELVSKPKAAAKPTAPTPRPTPARPTPRSAGAGSPAGPPRPASHRSSAQALHLGPARQPVPVPPQSLVHPHGPRRGLKVGKPVPAVRQALVPQRQGSPSRPGATRQGRPGMPPRSGNTLELVGSRFVATAAAQVAVALVRPPVRERLDVPACPLECANRWLPVSSCKKPVGRPTAPAPRRPDAPTKTGAGAGTATPPVARPNAPSAPRRPSFRPGGPGGQRRPGRPDWDDSARLDALRSRSPQKQRQKVHIIGENDDSLATDRRLRR